jgi:hypothetical protein
MSHNSKSAFQAITPDEAKSMLSKECSDCAQLEDCSRRHIMAAKGEKIYCPDGTARQVTEPISERARAIDYCCLNK